MAGFSCLGIGLSFLFGCFFLCLVGELYYLLWWKKKISISRGIDVKDLPNLFCWKKPNSVNTTTKNQNVTDHDSNGPEPDLELGLGLPKEELPCKGFGEEGVESELMRLHNLYGPPRFLFTISEETREDLESDDGKSRGERSRRGSRTRSLSDFLVAVETPLASPTLKANPSLETYSQHGFNPLFESSPPPKFKFLRDAEEKLMRRLMEEAEKRGIEERGGSFIRIIVGKNKEREANQQLPPQYHSNGSQVLPLPLASPPSPLRH